MTTHHATFPSASPDDTTDLAERVGSNLDAGDCVLLSGGIGAGKSHFARALILSRLAVPEDVPSPTFTLVQTYEVGETELWHADLYRLSDPDQIIELGLLDAFRSAICLVEWPERLGDLTPPDALHIHIADPHQNDTREITLSASSDRWSAVITKVAA